MSIQYVRYKRDRNVEDQKWNKQTENPVYAVINSRQGKQHPNRKTEIPKATYKVATVEYRKSFTKEVEDISSKGSLRQIKEKS